jgi:hypothetical protein
MNGPRLLAGEGLQTLTQDIENGLKARYRESEQLTETPDSLRISNVEMTVKLYEAKKTLAPLETRISQGESKYTNIQSKLAP